MLPIALSLLIAFVFIALLRTPGVFSPALVLEAQAPGTRMPDDDEDQMPETDRAPRHWLTWGVAAVGLVRIGLLVTLHA
jgi:hypothetical protein